MRILELPETTTDINILGKVYKLDITDFNVLETISELPSLNTQGTATTAQMELYVKQYQEMFVSILGEELISPKDTLQLKYFFFRSILVYLHNAIKEEQDKYLNLNYPVYDMEKVLQITNNLAKIKEGEGNQ